MTQTLSSQDIPSVSLAEWMTARNLLNSFNGSTCPACARRKVPGRTFCGRCFSALPEELSSPLARMDLDSGYDLAVLRAMRRLKCVHFHESRVVQLESVYPAMRNLSRELLDWSLQGEVCPRCGGDKSAGRSFCAFCFINAYQRALKHYSVRQARVIAADWRKSLRGRDRRGYLDAMLDVLRITRARRFLYAAPGGNGG